MADWKNVLKSVLLADGKIDEAEVAILRKEIMADGKVDDDEVEFLVGLRDSAKSSSGAFDSFFFDALSSNLLADGELDAAEATKVRKILMADGKVDDAEKKFLKALKGKAKKTSPEFDKLIAELGG